MSADDPTGKYRITVDGPARSVEESELGDVAVEIATALRVPVECVVVDDFAPTYPGASVSLRIFAPRVDQAAPDATEEEVPW